MNHMMLAIAFSHSHLLFSTVQRIDLLIISLPKKALSRLISNVT